MLRYAKSHTKKTGFTLIELLVVIGLLGALTALVLPSLIADREEAIGDVCDYNQAGTVRVLHQFRQLTGSYPSQMHSGLLTDGASATAMPGLPEAQRDHMVTDISTTRHALLSGEATSLQAAGITDICYGAGLNPTSVTVGTYVACAADGTNYWLDDADDQMTFDGVTVTDYCSASTSPDGKAGIVVALWISPTIKWEADSRMNQDWGGSAVKISLDMEGQCPIPQEAAVETDEVTFAYYMAYFKVYSDGTAAKMIGSTCPECGVLNP